MNTQLIDPFTLPKIPLSQRKHLPSVCAVYFVMHNNKVVYIGKATILKQRWDSHHRIKEFKKLSGEVRIAWLICDIPELTDELEKSMIARFEPSINGSKVEYAIPPKINKRERFPQGDTNRVSFTLAPGVRQRVDKMLPILGTSLSKTLRYLIDLGLDVFELAQKNGNSIPQVGSLDRMFSTYTSLGMELVFACDSLGLSVPEVGRVGIWFVDNLYPGFDNIEGIQRDEEFQASRIFRLSGEIQKLFQQQLSLLSEEEFAVFLRNLHQETIIGQEFIVTCQMLGLQPPQKEEIEEWLLSKMGQHGQLEQSNVSGTDSTAELQSTEDNLLGVNLQPFLEYLLTLDKMPTEEEQLLIARRFGVEPTHINKLMSRMRFDDKE